MKYASLLALAALAPVPAAAQLTPSEAWINEFHYDDRITTGDENEFIEVAVIESAASDPAVIARMSVVLYNGTSGKTYHAQSPIFYPQSVTTHPLSGFTRGITHNGITYFHKPLSWLQDHRGGFALVDGTTVVQALAYEAAFVAAPASIGGGPAAEQPFALIQNVANAPVVEDGSIDGTLQTSSVALAGTGVEYGAFAWQNELMATPGSNNTNQNAGVLPVELVAFTAAADGRTARLTWETASETNNAGFYVERRGADALWHELGFVAGRGTTTEAQRYAFDAGRLAPGRHAFRLRQVDTDGTVTHSAEASVEVALGAPFAVANAQPNPFQAHTRIRLAVDETQHVSARVYDALGRHVLTLHDGPLESGIEHDLVLEGATLPSGAYLVRIAGERFSATRLVTRAR